MCVCVYYIYTRDKQKGRRKETCDRGNRSLLAKKNKKIKKTTETLIITENNVKQEQRGIRIKPEQRIRIKHQSWRAT